MTAMPEQTADVGTSIDCRFTRCDRGGGYIVWVDDAVYAACSTLAEAVATIGRVAAQQYGEPATDAAPAPPPPPPSTDTEMPLVVARRINEIAAEHGQPTQVVHHVAQAVTDRMRATIGLALAMLVVGVRVVTGV